jgi:hypothetical protein
LIRIMSELPPHILGFEARGKVTAHDYETVLRPEIDRAAAEGDRLRLLYHLGPAFEGFSLGAMLDDARLGLGHLQAWEKIAVVTDEDWVRNSVGLFSKLVPGTVRVFPNSELPEARSWIEG